MTTSSFTKASMQNGTIARLNPAAGFGYVSDQSGHHQYIFVFGYAIKHAMAKSLFVGKAVHFRVSGAGRVDELLDALA